DGEVGMGIKDGLQGKSKKTAEVFSYYFYTDARHKKNCIGYHRFSSPTEAGLTKIGFINFSSDRHRSLIFFCDKSTSVQQKNFTGGFYASSQNRTDSFLLCFPVALL